MQPFSQAIITEKQRQADVLVEAYSLKNKLSTPGGGTVYYDREGGMAVLPLSGHIIGLKPPQFYQAELEKGWSLDALPVMPKINEFKFTVQDNPKAKRLLGAVTKVVKDIGAKELVIASDNDKEGELLVWEVLEYIGMANHPNKSRMLYAEITVPSLKDAFDNRVNAEPFRARYFAGLARLFSDWLYGMNITMAMTVENKENIPPRTVLNSGRVIFAISYILYLKEKEILDFVPKDYFNISAMFATEKGNYKGKLIVDERFKDKESGFLMDPAIAQKIINVIKSKKKAQIVEYEAGEKKQGPPLGFDRTGFSSHLAKKYRMQLKTINDTMQALYDQHSLLTYPRVDVEYLDVKMFDKVLLVLDAMKDNLLGSSYLSAESRAMFEKAFNEVDKTRKSRIFKKGINDEESHHAIIPTAERKSLDSLNPNEQLMYEEACKRLLMQFLPDYVFHNTKVTTKIIDAVTFATTGNIPMHLGWRMFDKPEPDEDEDDDKGNLPPLQKGQVVGVAGADLKKEKTKCPKRYTDDELLGVLKKPHRFIQNKELLKKIKKMEIGTSATRENHVTELQTKGYYDKKKDGKGKSSPERIFPTKKLMAVIEVAPTYFLYPEVSAYWEDAFNKIEKDISFFDVFMAGQYKVLDRFFADLKLGKFKLKSSVGVGKPCPEKECKGTIYKLITKKKFKLWSCGTCDSAWFDDKGNVGEKMGKPGENKPAKPKPKPTKFQTCPACKKAKAGHIPIPGQKWSKWECQDAKCGAQFFDDKGKCGKQMTPKK